MSSLFSSCSNLWMSSLFSFSTVSDSPILQRTENGIVPARVFERGEAWSEYKRQLAILKELFGVDNKVRLATGSNDLKDDGTLSAYIACGGGDFLDGLGRLDEAYADGVRAIQLATRRENRTSTNCANRLCSQ